MASGDNVKQPFWLTNWTQSIVSNFPHNISKTSFNSFKRWWKILRNSIAEHLSIDMLLSGYEKVYYNVPQISLTLCPLWATSLKSLIQSSHVSSESLDRFWLNHMHSMDIITKYSHVKLSLAFIYSNWQFTSGLTLNFVCLYTTCDRLWWNLIHNTQILIFIFCWLCISMYLS